MPGPSNLYGVANPVILPVNTYGNLTGTAAAGVATDFCPPVTMVSPSSGYFYPVVWLSFYIGFVSPLPTDLHVGFNVNGGSMVDNYQVDTALMTVSAWTAFSGFLVGTPSNTAWAGTGSTVHIVVQPSTNPVNIRGYTNRATIGLFRAPDQ
jgi:hypothetical protein